MHDGVGAWIKSAVARACLCGAGISTVEEFYSYCIQFLSQNTSGRCFTSRRHYYIITTDVITVYRATMPASVDGEKNIKGTKADPTGWFFWGLDGQYNIIQRRCACDCPKC